MSVLVANSQFDDFYQYLDSFRVLSLYQDEKQLETALSGSFAYKQISSSQVAVASSGDIIVVDGAGLTIPAGSLPGGSDSNLTWSDVGGTLQDVKIYQGGSFQNQAVSGGTLLLDATFSPTQLSVAYGGNQVTFTGSGFPTDVGSIGALLQGNYNGANLSFSSVTLQSGGKTVALSLSPNGYTITAGDYEATLTGTGLPTSFAPSFVEQLLNGDVPLTIGGSITGIAVTQISTGASVLSESDAAPIALDVLLSGKIQFFDALLSNVSTVKASAADVADALDRLNTLAYDGTLTSITLSDSATLNLTGSQVYDIYALAKITGSFQITASGISAYSVGALSSYDLKSYSISDYAESLSYAGISKLADDARSGVLTGVTLLDGGVPDITLAASDVTSGTALFNLIKGNYTVTIDAPYGGGTITGLAGHGSTVYFGGFASNSTVTLNGDGNGFSVKDALGTYQVSGVDAIRFYDQTDFFVQAPGSGFVTSGNLTELYSAVLAREPDVGGLAFYQTYLKANPATSFLQFAEWFLQSPEYSGNSAHDYAQTTAGDANFITDSYKNLLHRAPSAAEVSYYQANVMAPALAGLTSGTPAYSNAEFQAHAQMLVYFSASPEFLSDVQITSQHPASGQHWLYIL